MKIVIFIKNRLLFVINIINLLEVQYSISINLLLILILIQRFQIHEIVKIQNSVITSRPFYYGKFENNFRFKNPFYYFKRLISINVGKK